jgi:hypothetical protein
MLPPASRSNCCQPRLPLEASFWLGHQGYEYVDLRRVWQIALFAGLVIWLALMLRALWPALSQRTETRSLVWMFTFAATAVGLMYGAGFFFSAKTHLTVMEYWRWWVVHLWVEGFFEVFATAALSLIFARMGLVQPSHAGAAVIGSSALCLFSGIPGTFHQLYFSGTRTSIMAVGASFSALEVIPPLLIGFEAYQTSRMQAAATWMRRYRWPVIFFVGVAFWNLVGAGLFGFLINPPIALYYMQGLNTTPVHAHTALFGVYGLLSLGLVLVVARLLTARSRVEGGLAGPQLLGDEPRADADGGPEPAADRADAGLRQRRDGLVVRAQRRVPAAAAARNAAVAAHHRRYRVPHRRRLLRLVHGRALVWLERRSGAGKAPACRRAARAVGVVEAAGCLENQTGLISVSSNAEIARSGFIAGISTISSYPR